MTIVLRGNRIAGIAPSGRVSLDTGTVRIDGSGKFAIPGLWDMHVHVIEAADRYFPVLLAYGVTGIRNMHNASLEAGVRLRGDVETGPVSGPQVVLSGPLVDGASYWPSAITATSEEEGRRTLVTHEMAAYRGESRLRESPALELVPLLQRDLWRGVPAPDAEWAHSERAQFRAHLDLVGAMKRAGVRILPGTDVGNPWLVPGDSLHRELALLVEAGLSPMQALQSATRDAAEFLGRSNQLGTLQQGKIADLVLLDADPLDEIGNTRRIRAVVRRGRYLPREELDRLLATAKEGRQP